MERVQIEVAGDVAFCRRSNTTVVGDSPEEAVRQLLALLKQEFPPTAVFMLPYMGQDFSPKWEEIRFKPPPKEDEFEEMQKAYEFSRDKEVL